MNKFLTVVELCTTKVAVAVGENTDYGVQIIAHCTVPVRKMIRHGDVENTKKVVEALKTAVSMAQEEVGFVIHDVVLCLWGQSIRTCQIKVSKDRKRPEEFISDQELKVLNDTSLFAGILVGALFATSGNIIKTMDLIVVDGLSGAVADGAGNFCFLVILGILVAMINKSGGSAAFGRWAETHI